MHSSPRSHLTHNPAHSMLSLEHFFPHWHYLSSISPFSFVLICLFLWIVFYHDFSQLTFQSILQLFTDLILCGICKLAFGFRPLSQQIFVFGLFCSYLTADQQWLCFVVLFWDFMCVYVCTNSSVRWDCISVDFGDSVVDSPRSTPYGWKLTYFYLVCLFLFFQNAS